MSDSLSEETSQLLAEYLKHCSIGTSRSLPSLSPKARTLSRVTTEMVELHQDFFQDSCCVLETDGTEPALVLQWVVLQLEKEDDLNWGSAHFICQIAIQKE